MQVPMYPCSPSLLGASLLDGVDQQVHVVVKELEVIGDFLHTSDRRRHHEDFRAGVATDGVRCLQVEIRLHEYEFHVHSLHLINKIESVLRSRRDTWLWFDVTHNIE